MHSLAQQVRLVQKRAIGAARLPLSSALQGLIFLILYIHFLIFFRIVAQNEKHGSQEPSCCSYNCHLSSMQQYNSVYVTHNEI